MRGPKGATIRTGSAFAVAIVAALVVGGAMTRGRAAAPAPSPTAVVAAHIAAVRAPESTPIVPTPVPPAITPVTPTIGDTLSPTAGEAATTPAAASTTTPIGIPFPTSVPATPARANWIEVGQWAGKEMIITEPFTAHGPWRLCWTLPPVRADDVFQIMIGDAAETSWDIRTGPTGATSGSFDIGAGGSFRLMFHNDTPYVAVAIEPPPGVPATDLNPPLCGR